MGEHRILIVEDDPLVATHLESIVQHAMDTDVVVGSSIVEAKAAMRLQIDFALLDVDVLDGTTYAFATSLHAAGVPFAFLSASDREAVPDGLKHAPFIAKPYTEADVIALLRKAGRIA